MTAAEAPSKPEEHPRKDDKKGVKFFSSVQGFSLVMLGGSLATLAIGFLCWLLYTRGNKFGLPTELAKFLAATYVPVVLGSFLSFRDVLFSTYVTIDEGNDMRRIPISGTAFLYPFCALAFAVGCGGVIYASTPIDEDTAKLIFASGATIWGGTLGAVFERFFRQYSS